MLQTSASVIFSYRRHFFVLPPFPRTIVIPEFRCHSLASSRCHSLEKGNLSVFWFYKIPFCKGMTVSLREWWFLYRDGGFCTGMVVSVREWWFFYCHPRVYLSFPSFLSFPWKRESTTTQNYPWHIRAYVYTILVSNCSPRGGPFF